MCLDNKKFFWKKPKKDEIITGYKFFNYFDRTLSFTNRDETKFETDVWLKATEKKIGLLFNKYTSGFHAFLSLNDARDYYAAGYHHEIVEVLLRGVHTKGTQDGIPVIVASEMFIPKENTIFTT